VGTELQLIINPTVQSLYVSAVSAKPPSGRSKVFVMKAWNDWTARQDLTYRRIGGDLNCESTKHGSGPTYRSVEGNINLKPLSLFAYLNFGGLKVNFLPTSSLEKTRSGNAKSPRLSPELHRLKHSKAIHNLNSSN
jgi:hypothetical protein